MTESLWPGEATIMKMWETLVEKGIGALLLPWHTRQMAAAKADEFLLLAQAKQLADDVSAGRATYPVSVPRISAASSRGRVEPTIPEYASTDVIAASQQRAFAREMRKEINVARSVLHAEEAMRDQPSPDAADGASARIDDAWIDTWFENAGKASAETAQLLWGRILAGEARVPGRYSLRTLDFLRLMSAVEAQMVQTIAPFYVEGLYLLDGRDRAENFGVTDYLCRKLAEIGILNLGPLGEDKPMISISPSSNPKTVLSGRTKALLISRQGSTAIDVPAYMFTSLGSDVISLVECETDVEYMALAAIPIIEQGHKVEICDWQTVDSGGLASNVRDIGK